MYYIHVETSIVTNWFSNFLRYDSSELIIKSIWHFICSWIQWKKGRKVVQRNVNFSTFSLTEKFVKFFRTQILYWNYGYALSKTTRQPRATYSVRYVQGRLWRIVMKKKHRLRWEKNLIKITVLAQYSRSIFIFLFILYCRISKRFAKTGEFRPSKAGPCLIIILIIKIIKYK